MRIDANDRGQQVALALTICLLIGALWKVVPHPIVALAVGLVPLAGIFVMRVPFLMVLLFVIFSFFRIHEVFPQLYSLKIPLLLSLASLAALAWHVGITQKIETYWRPELTMVSIFFLLVVIGVVMASNRPVAINYFKGVYWKIGLMTFAIAWLTRAPKDFAFASKLIASSGAVVGLVALFNKANGIGLGEETRVTIGRAIGSVLGDPNALALVAMVPAALAVSLPLT